MKRFEVVLVIDGVPDSNSDQLKAAMIDLIKFAVRARRDRRFMWHTTHVEAAEIGVV